MSEVSINGKGITPALVDRAAGEQGVSKARLQEIAKDLGKLAEGMNFGDGKALQALADVVAQAANSGAAATQTDTAPTSVGTSRPGT
jgi:hypothetical protein